VSASVLIIDDHPLVREGIKRSLTGAGFNCVGEAGSLKEAIAMIALHNPDVITVDLNLPDGNGLEIISWARKNSASLAIIVLSLDDDLDLVSAASKAGAQGFISKSESQRYSSVTRLWLFWDVRDPKIFSQRENVWCSHTWVVN
jgi:DNA-binding NarL/FixJ family response regulator